MILPLLYDQRRDMNQPRKLLVSIPHYIYNLQRFTITLHYTFSFLQVINNITLSVSAPLTISPITSFFLLLRIFICHFKKVMNTTSAQFPYPWQRCKIIHLVRHGQAMHNVEGDKDRNALNSPHLFDAQLSPLGLQQVCKLRKDVHGSGLIKKVELVITSPLYRTMQTAIGVFGSENHADGGKNDHFSAISGGLNCPKIMAVELCRDRLGVRPCDMRRRVSECQALFPPIDFSMMDGEEDSMWNPDVREPEEEIAARMVLFMNWLWTRPEQEIVIVSHGIILQHILYVLGNDCHPTVRSALCKRFVNCELRSVVIVDKSLREADSPLCSPRANQNENVLREEVSN